MAPVAFVEREETHERGCTNRLETARREERVGAGPLNHRTEVMRTVPEGTGQLTRIEPESNPDALHWKADSAILVGRPAIAVCHSRFMQITKCRLVPNAAADRQRGHGGP